jgi:hypothetical protein
MPSGDQVCVEVFHLAMALHPSALEHVPALVNLPPTYTLLPLIAIV